MRAPLPTPKKGSLPLPASMTSSPLLEFTPSPQDLPGPGCDGSVCAPKDIWVGGETAALQRLKVRPLSPMLPAHAVACQHEHDQVAGSCIASAIGHYMVIGIWCQHAPPAHMPKLGVLIPAASANAILQYYLWDTDLIADYFNTRNGMLGGDYSTKFAPWLAHGCLSPRTIYAEIQRYQQQRTKNKSTYWVIFELIWRDFFK